MEAKPDLHDLMFKIIAAADCWVRHALRTDKELTREEQELCRLVLEYCRASRQVYEMPVELPLPPKIPKDLTVAFDELFLYQHTKEEYERDTSRYDEKPTYPSPPYGIYSTIMPQKNEQQDD